jgi:hypothetical protein
METDNPSARMLDAIEDNDYECLEKLVQQEKIKQFIAKEKMIMPFALQHARDSSIVKLLIDNGANINYSENITRKTLFHLIAEKKNFRNKNLILALIARLIPITTNRTSDLKTSLLGKIFKQLSCLSQKDTMAYHLTKSRERRKRSHPFEVDIQISAYLVEKNDDNHLGFLKSVMNTLNHIKQKSLKKFSEKEILDPTLWLELIILIEREQTHKIKSEMHHLLRDIVTYRATHAYHRFDRSRRQTILPKPLPLPPDDWFKALPPTEPAPKKGSSPLISLMLEDASWYTEDR